MPLVGLQSSHWSDAERPEVVFDERLLCSTAKEGSGSVVGVPRDGSNDRDASSVNLHELALTAPSVAVAPAVPPLPTGRSAIGRPMQSKGVSEFLCARRFVELAVG